VGGNPETFTAASGSVTCFGVSFDDGARLAMVWDAGAGTKLARDANADGDFADAGEVIDLAAGPAQGCDVDGTATGGLAVAHDGDDLRLLIDRDDDGSHGRTNVCSPAGSGASVRAPARQAVATGGTSQTRCRRGGYESPRRRGRACACSDSRWSRASPSRVACPRRSIVAPLPGLVVDDPSVVLAARVATAFDPMSVEVRVDGVDLIAALGLTPPFTNVSGTVSIGGQPIQVTAFRYDTSLAGNPEPVDAILTGLPEGAHEFAVRGLRLANGQLVADLHFTVSSPSRARARRRTGFVSRAGDVGSAGTLAYGFGRRAAGHRSRSRTAGRCARFVRGRGRILARRSVQAPAALDLHRLQVPARKRHTPPRARR
jgi:hypothetical protein